MRKLNGITSLGTAVLAMYWGSSVLAEFVPGHVFVTDSPAEFCAHPEDTGSSRIWEIDPATGEVSLFVEMPVDDCRWLNGLVFTPDGTRLRAGSLVTGSILEFDSEGNYEVVLDPSDGLLGPWGGNCITYDRQGNFYVADTGTTTLVQFPADGSPGIVLADFDDGIRQRMSIAFTVDGDLYLGPGGDGPILESENFLLRFDHAWTPDLFDPDISSPIDSPTNIVTDSAGYVYVRVDTASRTYRYRMGEPESRDFVASDLNIWLTGIAFSLSETHIYFTNLDPDGSGDQLSQLDVRDGSRQVIANYSAGFTEGLAVAPRADRSAADVDSDGDVDLNDVMRFQSCQAGPGIWTSPGCGLCDLDRDIDVDFADFQLIQAGFDK